VPALECMHGSPLGITVKNVTTAGPTAREDVFPNLAEGPGHRMDRTLDVRHGVACIVEIS